MLSFFSLLSLLWATPDSYQAVVIDAVTKRPLAGVAVTDLQTNVTLATDAAGRFGLPGPVAHFRLRYLGFAPAELTRAAHPPGQVDTLRLAPQSFALAAVNVRGARPVVLSGYAGKLKYLSGALLVPEWQIASLFQPDASTLGSTVQRLTVKFRDNHPTAGRVRVQLLPALHTTPFTPDLTHRDLLPAELVYTAAQIAALPNQELVVELAAYGISMPPDGLCILVEGLPTLAEEQFVEQNPIWTIVTALDPQNKATYRLTPADRFPAIMEATSATMVETTSRHIHGLPWRIHDVDDKHKRVENAAVSLTLLAEPAP